jgi:hypothetical protein
MCHILGTVIFIDTVMKTSNLMWSTIQRSHIMEVTLITQKADVLWRLLKGKMLVKAFFNSHSIVHHGFVTDEYNTKQAMNRHSSLSARKSSL